MKYTLLHRQWDAEHPHPLREPASESDRYFAVFEGEVDPNRLARFTDETMGEAMKKIADLVFNIHNDNRRPLRTRIRSMSVGDVVVFPEYETMLRCEMVGWSRVVVSQEQIEPWRPILG